jgi:hypothetical protein
MNEIPNSKWQKMRQIGKSKYLLLHGILPWSLSLTIFFGIIERVTQGETFWSWIPIRLILFATLGFFVANAKWQAMQRKHEAIDKKA